MQTPDEDEERYDMKVLGHLQLQVRPPKPRLELPPFWVSRRAYTRLWAAPAETIRDVMSRLLYTLAFGRVDYQSCHSVYPLPAASSR